LKFTQEEIARLRELADKAYPRPYISGQEAGFTAIAHHANGNWNNDALDGLERGEATGAYLVKAGNVLPDALDEIERLRDALTRIRTEHWESDWGGESISRIQDIAREALKGGE